MYSRTQSEENSFDGLEQAIEKLYINTEGILKEAEMYQATTEQTQALEKTKAAHTVVGNAYETISGFKVAAEEGGLECKED